MSWPGGDSPQGDDGLTGVEDIKRRLARGDTDLALASFSIPFETLPQLPFFAPLFNYTTDWHKAQIVRLVLDTSVHMGRLLTPAEAQALAYHRSKFCSRIAWSPPAVLLAAAYFTNRGRSTFRFPFYTPKPASFNPSFFPFASRPILTGPSAVRLWHALRFGAYGLVCQFVVKSFIISFAQTSYLVGAMQDDRLKSMRETMGNTRDQQRRQQPRRGMPSQSPATGATDFEGPPPYQSPTPAIGTSPERQQQLPRQQAQWSQPTSEPQNVAQDDDSFLFDDASPVAASQRRQPQRPSAGSAASTGGASSWDRIRQRAKSEEGAEWNPTRPQNGGAAGQQNTEQYTYAPAEQEKAYAQAQAQKEFDAMLERERRGMGDSGGRN